jgi:hypothetical protein
MEILERDLAVINADGGVISPRMREALQMRRAFLNGGTGNIRAAAGINGARKLTLSDGTVAYLKVSSGQIGTEIDDLKREIIAARVFEAVGMPDQLIITEVIDPATGKRGVLFKAFDNDGGGGRNNATALQNAREIALVDFLLANSDRHGGNWLISGNKALPIDHGLVMNNRVSGAGKNLPDDVNITLEKVLAGDAPRRGTPGPFVEMIRQWARGRRPNLFTAEEFEGIADRVRGLRQMYVDMGLGDYFEQSIMKRLDVLLGIERNQ